MLYKTAVFRTKFWKDQSRNGQTVEILKVLDAKGSRIRVRFPDGTEKNVYNTELQDFRG